MSPDISPYLILAGFYLPLLAIAIIPVLVPVLLLYLFIRKNPNFVIRFLIAPAFGLIAILVFTLLYPSSPAIFVMLLATLILATGIVTPFPVIEERLTFPLNFIALIAVTYLVALLIILVRGPSDQSFFLWSGPVGFFTSLVFSSAVYGFLIVVSELKGLWRRYSSLLLVLPALVALVCWSLLAGIAVGLTVFIVVMFLKIRHTTLKALIPVILAFILITATSWAVPRSSGFSDTATLTILLAALAMAIPPIVLCFRFPALKNEITVVIVSTLSAFLFTVLSLGTVETYLYKLGPDIQFSGVSYSGIFISLLLYWIGFLFFSAILTVMAGFLSRYIHPGKAQSAKEYTGSKD